MSQLTLPDMICFALYSANHAMQRVYQPLLAPLGLTYPQFLVLMALWEEDGRRVTDLGRALGLESNTLTPLLKRMEAQGLVARARDEQDERQVRVTLSEKGAGLKAEAGHISRCIFDACGLEVERLTALRDQITALRDRLAG
ncbi:MarR family winged helix-turn-helix transcriptional regulator [Stagnihabitans tardus]|uniref:MarR family transcriptional regulator n=1 Tax=Stagnihabitans tardus TaxID=2699202 RepID=A0AAE4Y6D5_9RHOB|nr:MarR family transcriptional regulator [Stagnihabitans tardus]NBZ86668.1 MarR family transcriptional regulator [Stagnihabitans tardus]